MNIYSEYDFSIYKLLSSESVPSLSLFIENHETWPQNKRAMKTLKSQIQSIKKKLSEDEYKSLETNLEKLIPWTQNGDLWQGMVKNLIIYVSSENLYFLQVDIPVKEGFHIGHFFDIRPLINIKNDQDFFILRCSPKGTALLKHCKNQTKKVKVTDLPTTPNEEENQDIEQFAQLISKSLFHFLKSDKKPVIAFGLSPLLDRVCESLFEVADIHCINKNPDELQDKELLLQAKIELSKLNKEKQKQEIENFLDNYHNHQNVTNELETIIRYAFQGQINELYIPNHNTIAGKFFLPENGLPHFEKVEDSEEDLLNIATIFTLQNGGTVYQFDADKTQIPHEAVAILRGDNNEIRP